MFVLFNLYKIFYRIYAWNLFLSDCWFFSHYIFPLGIGSFRSLASPDERSPLESFGFPGSSYGWSKCIAQIDETGCHTTTDRGSEQAGRLVRSKSPQRRGGGSKSSLCSSGDFQREGISTIAYILSLSVCQLPSGSLKTPEAASPAQLALPCSQGI